MMITKNSTKYPHNFEREGASLQRILIIYLSFKINFILKKSIYFPKLLE